MKLKKATLITIIGIAASFIVMLARFPWNHIVQNPEMIISLVGTTLLHSSLLFFLINLYRRG